MTINRSVAARQAAGDSFETLVTAAGTLAPKIKFFSGAKPTACVDADPTGHLGTLTLPVDCFVAADTSGKNVMNGTWSGTANIAGGTIASYRFYANNGTTCHEQGSVTATGGGGDMTVDNAVVAQNQVITVTQWDRTQANA